MNLPNFSKVNTFNIHTISKTATVTALTSIITLSLMTTGCDKSKIADDSQTSEVDKQDNTDAKDTDVKDNTDTKDNPKDTTEKAKLTDEQIKAQYKLGDGKATAEMMSVSLFMPIQMMYSINGDLTPEQVGCIQKLDHQQSIPDYQKFLTDKFDTKEIRQLDNFYASNLGKDLSTIATEQIGKMVFMAGVKGSVINLDNFTETQIAPAEQKKLHEFTQTDVGIKLGQHIMGENYKSDGLVNYTLPALDKALKACQVSAPKVEEMDKWTVDKPAEAEQSQKPSQPSQKSSQPPIRIETSGDENSELLNTLKKELELKPESISSTQTKQASSTETGSEYAKLEDMKPDEADKK